MITLEQPSLALNAATGHHVFANMWNTGAVQSSKTPAEIAQWILTVASSAPGGKLKNVVFCCHGSPGSVGLGTGINTRNLSAFSTLAPPSGPVVEKFWFRCCNPAHTTPTTPSTDGHRFVSSFARTTKAYVVASTETQWSSARTLPFGQLDGFEGLVLSYGPSGNITWQHRYRSGWSNSAGVGQYQTPD
jgi:hypothetical protein